MQVYQIHKEHGRHIAGTGLEEKANIKEGWKTVTEKVYFEGIEKELKDKKADIIKQQKADLAAAEAELDD